MAPKPALYDTRIFVFGSNLAGIHGAGAAAYALRHHGAVMYQGIGLQGQSYAIPTKNRTITAALSLDQIDKHVHVFKEFAKAHPEMRFNVTRIGCGLAGYKDIDIAPLFMNAPSNCDLPLRADGAGEDWATICAALKTIVRLI